MQGFETVKQWLRQITDIGLLILALLFLAQIVFGSAWPGKVDIVSSLITAVKQFGDAGLAGLIGIGIIVWLFSRRTPG